jgi:hypothetical protein
VGGVHEVGRWWGEDYGFTGEVVWEAAGVRLALFCY